MITDAQYKTNEDGDNIAVWFVDSTGLQTITTISETNEIYQELLSLVESGDLTIRDAD